MSLATDSRAVFPCLLNKAPACEHGFKDATTDPDVVRDLWRRWPTPLVGIATGAASDLAVLDIDVKSGGRDWWTKHRHRLPNTRTIRTRSGGLHLWFQHAPGLRCSAGSIAPGIDVRADGGYVIAWAHAGLPVLREMPSAPWPAWLHPAEPRPVQRPPDPPRVPDDVQTEALVRFVRTSGDGERNKRLFWAGCRMACMVASRLMSEAEAERLLTSAAMEAGLTEAEAARTARSGLAAGRGV
jgi:hypothetical protein